MTAKPYQIATDPARKLITMSFDPLFWDDDVSRSFIRDCAAAVTSLACDQTEQLILVDLRHAVIQSKEVYDRMLVLVGSAVAKRIALVAAAPVARMQTKRLQVREDVLMFHDFAAAEHWLFGDDEAAVA